MTDLIAIAQNTWGRLARQKSLYVILLCCVFIVAAMSLYGTLSAGRDQIMMLDAALAISLLVGMSTAVSAAFELPRELKEQTAQLILSKPLGRLQFVVGKSLGISALCIFNVAFICLGSAIAMHIQYGEVPLGLYSGCALIAMESVVLVGVAVLLSLLTSDVIAAVGTFVVFALGHAIYMLPRMFESGFSHTLAVAISSVLPNFHHFDFQALIGSGVILRSAVLMPALGYAIAYAVALLALSVAIFERRDIN